MTAAGYMRARLAEFGRRLCDTVRRALPPPRGFDLATLPPPPWILRPDWPPDSIGWRMGGEAYFHDLRARFAALGPAEQAAYERAYPAPPAWRGTLDAGRKGWRLLR